MDAILVLNVGSSSIKFAAYDHASTPDALHLIGMGHMSQVGDEMELLVQQADGALLEHSRSASTHAAFEHSQALASLFVWLAAHRGGLTLAAVGHRVVHGGHHYAAPVRITDAVLQTLDGLVSLAPLHQPHHLKAIRILRERWPDLLQVACFDTAFHRTQPWVAQALALPRAITDAGVRRYGFHGLSYEYIATQLPRVLGPAAQGRVVAAHLGNGASLCALVDGKSVASSMGFSALDGLVMGTRCGRLDPGVLLYLLQERHMAPQEVSDLLYRQSGLLGVSGISSDMQVLLASTEPHAAQAIALFVYRIVTEIGALAAAMGGLDALVFTAGIGEHSAAIRALVCAGCAWLGAELDVAANASGQTRIHTSTSRLPLAVISTNEERMIALHTLRNISE